MSWQLERAPRNGFCQELLPDPITYYTEQRLTLRGSGPWRTGLCPFHEEKHPSFSVNIENGAFRCHACNERGGDVLAFHMRRYELSFKEAARELCAWR